MHTTATGRLYAAQRIDSSELNYTETETGTRCSAAHHTAE